MPVLIATAAVLMAFCFTVMGASIGWLHAHTTVAAECERLGSFFVGSKTYECELKGNHD